MSHAPVADSPARAALRRAPLPDPDTDAMTGSRLPPASALLALAITACAHTADTSTPPGPSTAMTTSQALSPAEDIGRRVLALIDSIHGPEQIAPGHIAQVTGHKVETNPDDPNEYGFGGQIGDQWSYNLVSLTEANGGAPRRLMFSFEERTRGRADMGPVCVLDADDYAASLKAAGFSMREVRGRHERLDHLEFTRGGVTVQLHPRGENDADPTHLCVSQLIVNV